MPSADRLGRHPTFGFIPGSSVPSVLGGWGKWFSSGVCLWWVARAGRTIEVSATPDADPIWCPESVTCVARRTSA